MEVISVGKEYVSKTGDVFFIGKESRGGECQYAPYIENSNGECRRFNRKSFKATSSLADAEEKFVFYVKKHELIDKEKIDDFVKKRASLKHLVKAYEEAKKEKEENRGQ